MAERKHFVAIVVLIGVITVLFQFSAIVKGVSADYTSNRAAETSENAFKIKRSLAYDPEAIALPDNNAAMRRLVIFVGAKESPYRDAAYELASFAKWRFTEAESLAEVSVSQAQDQAKRLYIVDPAAVSWPGDIARLQEAQRAGSPVVLCSLPDESLVEKNNEVRSFLGIARVRQPSVELTGFHLFEGLLLGGAKVYRNTSEEPHLLDGVDLDVPWYVLAGGSKVYLRGEVDTEVYPDAYAHDEIIPPLMWRFSEGYAPLFVTYGPVLARPEGFGLLMAFVAECSSYEVWPVANAQVLALNDYPVLSKENDAEMQRIYARDSTSLQRDIVWGSISSLVSQNGAKPTLFLAPELDSKGAESPSPDLLQFYLRSIDELGGEMGLACDSIDNDSLIQKIQNDMAFVCGEVPSYEVSAISVRTDKEHEVTSQLREAIEGVHTVITLPANKETEWGENETNESYTDDENRPVVGFLSDTVMHLSTLSNCWHHTVLDDLALRACETGLGYSCVTFDLKGLLHPSNKDDEWQEGYRKMLSNYSSYWEPFRSLRQVSATTCDAYVRKTLAIDFSSSREGNTIVLTCGDVDDVRDQSFFLKLHDEHVVSVAGGSFQALNNGFYAIRLDDSRAVVEVASDMQPTVVR